MQFQIFDNPTVRLGWVGFGWFVVFESIIVCAIRFGSVRFGRFGY